MKVSISSSSYMNTYPINQMYGDNTIMSYSFVKNKQIEEESTPEFKIVKNPSELLQIDIIWDIALNCQNEKVIPKALEFLIKIYSSVDASL